MRRTTGTLTLALALALACSLAPGCTCSWFAPSAKGTQKAGPHEIALKAQAHRSIGVDGWGVPHAPVGMIWPTVDGYGLSVQASVDGRPEVTVSAKSTKALADEAELKGAMAEVAFDASPDGNHVAYKAPSKPWLVLHLLPKGTPFDSGREVAPGEKVDFASLPTPEAIALEALGDEKSNYGAKNSLLWAAVLEQTPGPPFDDALLAPFPEVKAARAWALERFEKKPLPSPAWREAACERAVGAIASGKARNKEALEACVELVLKADLPARRDALDAALANEWAVAQAAASHLAFEALTARLGVCSLSPFKKGKTPPPSPASRGAMVAVARGLFDKKMRRHEAFEVVVAAGSDADRARADDALAAQWPEGDDVEGTHADGRKLHEQLADRAAGKTTSVCSQKVPPPGPEWRARLRDKARSRLSNGREGEDAACLLVSLGEQPDLDAGLDYWLEHLPGASHNDALLSNATRGSAAWQGRAKARAEKVREGAEAKLASRYDADEERRLKIASALLYRLEYETADCARLAELRGKGSSRESPLSDLPGRCAKK